VVALGIYGGAAEPSGVQQKAGVLAGFFLVDRFADR
jgi:hypothetical protein